MKNHTFLAFTAILLAVALTTGCEKKDIATQVAAKVNGDEITVHQVNNVLAQRQDIKPENEAQAKRAILDSLINQQLARQKAIEYKLDRSPKVVQAIEAAKTEILARAHLDGITATLHTPEGWEIQDYYAKHPELFAQRRIFTLEELLFVGNDDVNAELRKQLDKASSMKEITDWLQSRGIKFVARRGTRAAEQIPLDILPRVQAMKKGEIQPYKDTRGGRYQVIRVVDFLEAPVDEATAAPRIQTFLFNQISAEAIAREMNEIRKQAKIEYMGEFAGDAAAAKAKVKAETKAKP